MKSYDLHFFFFHLFAINNHSFLFLKAGRRKKEKKKKTETTVYSRLPAGISEGLEHRKLLDISFSAITMHISTFMTRRSEVNVRQAELIKSGLIE